MYLRDVARMSVTDLLSMAEAAGAWFKVASEGASPEEELARERLYNALKLLFVGRSLGGMDPAHDPSGWAQHAWEERRDKLVRDVALVGPWDLSRGASVLRGGPVVASQNECEAWTLALKGLGVDWTEIDSRAREMRPKLPAGEVNTVGDIVHFLTLPSTSRKWEGDVQPLRLAKNLGVTWEALLKKARFLKAATAETPSATPDIGKRQPTTA